MSKDLELLAKKMVKFAKDSGADEAEVIARTGQEMTAKIRLGKVELLQEAGSRALGLRVFKDKREALTYTSDMRDDALLALAQETVALAKLSEPDELHELPTKDLMAEQVPDLGLYDESFLSVSADDALEMAKRGEKAAMESDKRISNSDGASWSRVAGEVAFANSQGFAGSYRGSYGSLYVEPVCEDQDDKKRNGYWWTGSRKLSEMATPEEVGRVAAKRTLDQLGAKKLPTGKVAVVFDPEAARAIIGIVAGAANGSAFYRKSTFLLEKEGQAIAAKGFTLVDDPLRFGAPGSRPFDGEGLAARRNVIVDGGVLKTILCDTYTGRKLNRASTGSASRGVGGGPGPSTSNLYLEAGDMSPEEIIRSTGDGLYVTSMMGFGFNPVTGDFSRGAAGFLIKNGELSHAVSEVTISANFNDLLMNIDAIGNDLDFRSSTTSPTLRVSEMMLAGN